MFTHMASLNIILNTIFGYKHETFIMKKFYVSRDGVLATIFLPVNIAVLEISSRPVVRDD